ncbi:MAG: NTP transferase domain-containing protein, partial [Chloroflexi bacterium]|nr:NTP transferase domain-containing protein [Chloroflexota bacterium]
GTIVVTMDPGAAGLARDHRAIGLVERAPGLNAAIRAARSVAVARGATAILVLPADLPAITPSAVDDLLEAGAKAFSATGQGLVAIVPDRHGSGTNALLVSPPALVEPHFGSDSLLLHRAAGGEAGATVIELAGPLSLDLDTPADLLTVEAELGSLHG